MDVSPQLWKEMFLHRSNLQVQGGEGASAWTLTGDPPGTAAAPNQARPWQVFEEHHGHKPIKCLHMSYCNLMELLLFEFHFKRGEISKNACVLSPFLSLPLNL